MSALTDLFTAMANKIRSKTGTQITYTPAEMVSDGIDDVFDAGVASVPTPTSITPSNSSPVALTANVAVKPSAAGYAIESYSIITPNSSAPTLAAGSIYKPNSNGYAINSYQSKTPSASGVSFNSGFVKMSSSGYAYSAQFPVFGGTPDKTYQNNTAGTSGTADITVSKKPRYIVVAIWGRNSNYRGFLGVVDVEQQKGYRMGYVTSGAINESWSGYSNYFTTISATKVTYNVAGFGENHRVQIQIFY